MVLSEPGRLTTVPAHQADILGRMGIRIGELFVHSIYNGYWFWGHPPSMSCGMTCAKPPKRSALTGI